MATGETALSCHVVAPSARISDVRAFRLDGDCGECMLLPFDHMLVRMRRTGLIVAQCAGWMRGMDWLLLWHS